MSALNLHRLAGALETLRHEAAEGTCALGSCGRPAIGYIEGWDLHPRGICAVHEREARNLGYVVHAEPEMREGEPDGE